MNPAENLQEIYLKIIEKPESQQVGLIWAEVFSIDVDGEFDYFENDIVYCLTQLRNYIDHTRQLLIDEGCDPGLFNPALLKFKEFSSPSNIKFPLSQVKDVLIKADTFRVLGWVKFSLRHFQEAEVNEAEIKEILDAIRLLEIDLLSIEISSALRNFIRNQINLLKNAILASKVLGSQILKEATEEVAGTLYFQQNELGKALSDSSEESKKAFTSLTKIVMSASKAGEAVENVTNLIKHIKTGYEVIQTLLLPFIDK